MTQNSPQGLESLGAEFLERHMKREQLAFFVFVGVFMFLLIGIATLFIYNGMVMREDLANLSRQADRSRFEAVASISKAKSDSQSARESLSNEVVELRHQAEAAREDIEYALSASQRAPDELVDDAVRFAKAHILGWPLNDSTASVVTAAGRAQTIDNADQLLLDYAIADWRGDGKEALSLAAQLPTDGVLGGYRHAVNAKTLFDKAAEENYPWSPGAADGCGAVEQEVNSALFSIAREDSQPVGFEDKGLLLNLFYYKGQCQRKAGRAEAGFVTFTEALSRIEAQPVPDSNPNKFQAYHGAGSTLTVLVGSEDLSIIMPPDPLLRAEEFLRRAADLRLAWGQTEVGKVGSTENISFIYLRESGARRWDKILKHTAEVDSVTSMSWNLIARLMAATEKAKLTPPGSDSCQTLREIIFDTGAKLSRRTAASFDREELQHLLTRDYESYLYDAERWVDLAELERIGDDVRLTAASDSRLQTANDQRFSEMIEAALTTPCTGGG